MRSSIHLILLALTACGSGAGAPANAGADAAPACASIAGTWAIVENLQTSQCTWSDSGEHTTTWDVAQSGCTADIDMGQSSTVHATIDGSRVSVTGTVADEGDVYQITSGPLTLQGGVLTGTIAAQSTSGPCSVNLTITGTLSQSSTTADAGTGGTPTNLSAQVVGYWVTSGTNCQSGSVLTGYVYALCPSGRIRGAGKTGDATELVCGSYTTSRHTIEGCNDKYGCFDKISATVKSTLILGGQTDVDPAAKLDLYLGSPNEIFRTTQCGNGSAGLLFLDRAVGSAEDNDCVSSACPAPGGSSDGSYGTCGTDCDCGRCWYCDKSGGSGTCRYGGEGPYGCYRGCG